MTHKQFQSRKENIVEEIRLINITDEATKKSIASQAFLLSKAQLNQDNLEILVQLENYVLRYKNTQGTRKKRQVLTKKPVKRNLTSEGQGNTIMNKISDTTACSKGCSKVSLNHDSVPKVSSDLPYFRTFLRSQWSGVSRLCWAKHPLSALFCYR